MPFLIPAIPAIIGGVAAVGAAKIASSGAKKAADAQVGAATQANDTQLNIFNQQRADQEPWRQAGIGALGQLTQLTQPGFDVSGWLSSQPGYKFGMDQGIAGINQNAASRGLLNSGANLKNLNMFAQDYAGTKFNDMWNHLGGLAGIGQTATNQLGAAGQNYANQFGNNAMAAGNARASGYANNGQTMGNALGQVGGIAANYLNAQYGPVSPAAWSPSSFASQGQGYSSSGYLNGLF
jgi:hypothetical protein